MTHHHQHHQQDCQFYLITMIEKIFQFSLSSLPTESGLHSVIKSVECQLKLESLTFIEAVKTQQ